jgi:hypothetical protein
MPRRRDMIFNLVGVKARKSSSGGSRIFWVPICGYRGVWRSKGVALWLFSVRPTSIRCRLGKGLALVAFASSTVYAAGTRAHHQGPNLWSFNFTGYQIHFGSVETLNTCTSGDCQLAVMKQIELWA